MSKSVSSPRQSNNNNNNNNNSNNDFIRAYPLLSGSSSVVNFNVDFKVNFKINVEVKVRGVVNISKMYNL